MVSKQADSLLFYTGVNPLIQLEPGKVLADRGKSRTTLGAELVLLDLQRKLALVVPSDTPSRHQVKQAFLIQLRRPTNRNLKTSANRQIVIRCKQNTGTANVERLSVARKDFRPLVKSFISDFTLNREPARSAPFVHGHISGVQLPA